VTFPFDPKRGPIFVEAELTGPAKTYTVRLILDTGATTSLVNLRALLGLGYALSEASQLVPMITGSGVTTVPFVVLTRLSCLGQHRFGFRVIAHELPASSAVDGLLGLDFLRDQALTIDFRTGHITVARMAHRASVEAVRVVFARQSSVIGCRSSLALPFFDAWPTMPPPTARKARRPGKGCPGQENRQGGKSRWRAGSLTVCPSRGSRR
jgi:hypothetical protein